MKIVPKTAEKRLKRFARPPIKHDEAQYQHAFDHRGPWYRQRSAISTPTRLSVTGYYGPANATFFETVVVTRDGKVGAGHRRGDRGSVAAVQSCGKVGGQLQGRCPTGCASERGHRTAARVDARGPDRVLARRAWRW